MMDVTPVENIFIQEYMAQAPGDYVKVYIYGLMQAKFPECAEESFEKFCRSINLPEQSVNDAIGYWQRNGLVRYKDNKCVFLSVKGAMLFGGASLNESYMYRYSELNSQLSALFGSRKLKQTEWRIVYDWVEVLGISEEAVVMLVKYCIQNGGKRVSMQHMNATARDWAQRGILTPDKAGEYVSTFHLTMTDANRVAQHFGFKRRVTQSEYDLYEKWTKQFGFDLEAILALCSKTAGSSNPNFSYLDKIVESYYKKGLVNSSLIKTSLSAEHEKKALVKECAAILGVRPSPANESYYDQWRQTYNLEHDAVLQILKEAAQNGVTSFKDADTLVGGYVRVQKTDVNEIRETQRLRRKYDADLQRIKEELGLRMLSGSERKILTNWLSKVSIELILQGAEYATGASMPVIYLNKILESWEKNNISTVSEAQNERNKFIKTSRKTDIPNETDSKISDKLNSLVMVLGDTNEKK